MQTKNGGAIVLCASPSNDIPDSLVENVSVVLPSRNYFKYALIKECNILSALTTL